jgi:hypothetical protein
VQHGTRDSTIINIIKMSIIANIYLNSIEMGYSKTSHIYKITRMTGNCDNFLATSFAENENTAHNSEGIEVQITNTKKDHLPKMQF